MISIENSGLVDFLPNLDITEEDMMYVYNLDDDFLNKRDSVYKVWAVHKRRHQPRGGGLPKDDLT